ncbi:MAG: phage holin [Enterococcus sp.]
MKKIDAGTLSRTIVLFIALLNQIFAISGIAVLDINENDVYQIVSLIFTIGSAVIAWWKNNSFSIEAIKADQHMKELKQGSKNDQENNIQ